MFKDVDLLVGLKIGNYYIIHIKKTLTFLFITLRLCNSSSATIKLVAKLKSHEYLF